MPGKTPHSNGNEPVENDYRSNKDADVKEGAKAKGKKSAKDADEEMTVVVPPSKAAKQSSAPPPADADGDVSMSGDKDAAEDNDEVKVDPVVQTIAGKSKPSLRGISNTFLQQGLTCDSSVACRH